MSLYDEVHHKYKLACTELREATDALDDPAVNNIRTLPEGIRLLRAENERLRGQLSDAERVIDRARRIMGGEGVEDQGQAWDQCLLLLESYSTAAQPDAALECVNCEANGKPICGDFHEEGDEEGRPSHRCVHCGHDEDCHLPVGAADQQPSQPDAALFSPLPPLIDTKGGLCAAVSNSGQRIAIGDAGLSKAALLSPHMARVLLGWLQRATPPQPSQPEAAHHDLCASNYWNYTHAAQAAMQAAGEWPPVCNCRTTPDQQGDAP